MNKWKFKELVSLPREFSTQRSFSTPILLSLGQTLLFLSRSAASESLGEFQIFWGGEGRKKVFKRIDQNYSGRLMKVKQYDLDKKELDS